VAPKTPKILSSLAIAQSLNIHDKCVLLNTSTKGNTKMCVDLEDLSETDSIRVSLGHLGKANITMALDKVFADTSYATVRNTLNG